MKMQSESLQGEKKIENNICERGERKVKKGQTVKQEEQENE